MLFLLIDMTTFLFCYDIKKKDNRNNYENLYKN